MAIHRPLTLLPPNTTPRIWIGANYWSRAGGPFMWREIDPDVIRQELEVLRDNGLNVTRSFFFLPDFMPTPDMIDEAYVHRYGQFLDLCSEVGIATIPTFIVGHMSGQNWDVPWRNGRDLYADGWMLAQQAYFIREMSGRFKDHPCVAGWLISNEMPLYGGPTTPEYGRSWARLMVQAVRASGAQQPVSLGEGAWGIEVTGRDNGFRLRDLAPIVDFIGPHVYPMGNDIVRQHLTAAFACELSHFGKPVILEEFGLTTDFASEQHAAEYYRQVLNTTLLAGTAGWIAWNNTDFDLVDQNPYRHHPFELHFGITTPDGEPKAPLLELQKFRQTLERIDLTRCRRPDTDVALLVTSYLETEYPFTPTGKAGEDTRTTIRDILLQAYTVTKEADLPAALVREADGIPEVRLILVPSTKALTGPTWALLERRAQEGAVVYASYFPGELPVQRGPWHPDFNRFFGIEHQLRYGLVNPVEEDVVTWTFVEQFGDLAPNSQLSFRVEGTESGRAFLPLIPREARVLAVDQHQRPALIERAVGNGAIVLSAYPIEYFAAMRSFVNPEDSYRLYRALGQLAGITLRATVDRPDVLTGSLVRDDGLEYLWFISESAEDLHVEPCLHDGQLADLESGSLIEGPITLSPYGVQVYQVKERQ